MFKKSAVRAALDLAFPLCMVLSMPATAAPFSFDSAPGRLPKNVVPLDYSIAIVPDIKGRTLAGTETVTLDFRQASATIVFNSLNNKLHDVQLDGKPVQKVASDDSSQLTTVTLASPAAAGQHSLRFSYEGKIGTDPQGLFAQAFVKPDGSKDLMLSTQFESTDARRMFPCWDEPAFRATYQLTATVPSAWSAISNMPMASQSSHDGLTTTTFQRTPKMPSYLVEFSAGDLGRITSRAGNTELGVWAVRGQVQNGAVALANAKQILTDYNDYFGVPFPLPKLDSIAVPGGFSGAMENWGAITYNDQLLLVSPSSTLGDRQQVFSTQAHEMAHQWNGDLVTMGWWDDLWLNESFASWRAAKETDLRNPSWKWWETADEDKEAAMSADAHSTSHAIEQHVTDELQASNAFDPQITYNKGQAVLRMLEADLGPDTFREGIRGYMKARAYSNATSTDLWNALSKASGSDVAAIAAGWTDQPGFPEVAVTASCDAAGKRTISLSQHRFLLQGTDTGHSHWSIPLQVRSGADAAALTLLLTHDGQTAAAGRCDEPLSVNASAIGYYRVKYDDATLGAITHDFDKLNNGDRIALLDDQWALVQSGEQPLPAYLALASSMGADLDERAWNQITGALDLIEYNERGSPQHDAFTAYARTIIKPVAERLGWDAKADETPGTQNLRRTVIGDLGAWGDADIIAQARKRFAAFVTDRKAIKADDQSTILSIVALNADAATFEQLHTIAKSAHDETELRRYYAALMQVRDPQLAEKAAQIALSPEIPAQAASLRLQLVGQLSDYHAKLSWQLFTQNTQTLLGPQGGFAPIIIAQYSPSLFWNAVPLDELEAWVKTHTPAEMAPNLARGMETARFKVARKALLVKAVDRYLDSRVAQQPGKDVS